MQTGGEFQLINYILTSLESSRDCFEKLPCASKSPKGSIQKSRELIKFLNCHANLYALACELQDKASDRMQHHKPSLGGGDELPTSAEIFN